MQLEDSVPWARGHSLITRCRQLEPDEKSRFYQVNKFVKLAHEDFRDWAKEIDECCENKGRWRSLLGLDEKANLDLEIGTGNGYFFEHRARTYPERGLLGIELKYKPLIQTVKRTLLTGHRQFQVLRYNARFLNDLFDPGELNDVFIFFPDPWEKRKENKHRLINAEFLEMLHRIQRPGSRLQIKTDSPSYFKWIVERMTKSSYDVVAEVSDLHSSIWAESNFQTHFERLWTRKGRKTHFLQLHR